MIMMINIIILSLFINYNENHRDNCKDYNDVHDVRDLTKDG